MTSNARNVLLRSMLLALVLVGLTLPAIAADEAIETEEIMLPMSDGIELATTVYRPKQEGAFPVIVSRTPYNKDGLKGEAQRFCKYGYAFVAQDLRGRFKSKGRHAIIFHNDGWNTPHDGHDTLEWIGRQKWCNGT